MDQASEAFVRANHIAVLSTIGPGGFPQACTIFYVTAPDGSLVFKSRVGSDHIIAAMKEPASAVGIYRHDSTYMRKAGIQLRGQIVAIRSLDEMVALVDLYSAAFDGARERFAPTEELVSNAESTLFKFVVRAYKLTDGWSDRVDHEYREVAK